MEALYSKLYDKYTKIKTQKESEMDKLNRDQEVKFMKYITAADELIEHLRNENQRLHEQSNKFRSDAASIRSSTDEQKAEYQKLLKEEKQKNNQLSEEIERLQYLQREGLCCRASEGNTEIGQLNMSGRMLVGSGRVYTRKSSRHYGTSADEVLDEPECCRRKIDLSGGESNVTGPTDCIYHDLLELLVSLRLSTIPGMDGRSISAVHQSSGYSFSLTLVNSKAGEVELWYRLLSLGTFERVAPEWMKEDVLRFSTRMCPVFFQRVSHVIKCHH